MYRRIIKDLTDWKLRNKRKPLILLGARQVGKTYIVKEFGQESFSNFIYVNCHQNTAATELFRDMDTKRIRREIERLYDKKIVDGKTLLFFDEIQEVANGVAQTAQSGSGTGSYTKSLTGLSANTTYYYKAYAINSIGTSYGEVMSFTTSCDCGGSYKVTDRDGNQYGTVLIGNQCWMQENLRTTHYANGTSINLGSSTSTTTAYRYYPNNNSSNVSTYGYLYNWKAVMGSSSSSSSNPSGVQGICPTGWHVPSNAEWTQLVNYLKTQSQYQCGSSTANIGKSLAATSGWNSSSTTCAVGNTQANNNSSGFSAKPAGCYWGTYGYMGAESLFWSTNESTSESAYFQRLKYNSAISDNGSDTKVHGYSVRCVRD